MLEPPTGKIYWPKWEWNIINEEKIMINVAELLKDCPKGTKLYSPLFGEVEFDRVTNDSLPICILKNGVSSRFDEYGRYIMGVPDAECLLFPSKEIRTWEGWEIPIEPKFKVGDWIVRNNGSSDVPIQIYNLKKDKYLVTNMLGSRGELMINRQDEWSLWTVEDVIDGDILVLNGKPFIYSHNKYGKNYCYIDDYGQFRVNFNLVFEGNYVCPATKEQRDLLFTKMQEVGYEWDADKKEIKRVVPHYHISNFKPFDKVLIRFGNKSKWYCDFFSHYDKGFCCIGSRSWIQCIPYEGNEHLLGTSDMCDEQYINW